jgi:hypothetical protein
MSTEIKIELSVVEGLKFRIEQLEQREEILKNELKKYDESDIMRRAVTLSEKLLKEYIKQLFKTIGIEPIRDHWVIDSNLEQEINKGRWEKITAKFQIGVDVSNGLIDYYARLGIDTNHVKPKHKSEFEL